MAIQFKRFKRRSRGSAANVEKSPPSPLSYQLNKRPTFMQWMRAVWLDIVCLCLLGAIGLGAFVAAPAAHRYFPITFNDGQIVYPAFAYPYRPQIVARSVSGSILTCFADVCFKLAVWVHRYCPSNMYLHRLPDPPSLILGSQQRHLRTTIQ